MQQIYSFALGIVLLVLGIPIGNILTKKVEEELKPGKKWFKLLIILSLVGAVIFIILGKDAIFFTLLFIAVVTSRSLKK